MKIKQILYLMSFCLLLSATTFAQQVQEFTVSGTVVDKDKLSTVSYTHLTLPTN